MFKVDVIGNLGADAEIKDVNGSKFVTMRVAHVDKWTTQTGEKKEVTTWIDVTMNDVESKIIPFLKTGVKIFVRGNASLRVYSSPKERMMKAGLQVSTREIELVGGVAELVPKQIIDPATSEIVDVQKYYWCNGNTKGMKASDTKEMIDQRGNRYMMNNKGFVAPVTTAPEDAADESHNESDGEPSQQ